jgi:methionine-S-sulfoxide reductase
MQPFFDRVKGVKGTMVGYIGGDTQNPTYEEVSSGQTGHAEAIEITYDPSVAAYKQLLNIYWRNIDPTVEDAQFVDHGSQYRSAIFYHNDEQKRIAEESKKELAASGRFNKPIVTAIVPASKFYPAEDYHQKYYQKSSFRYEMYHANTGRDEFKTKHWGKDTQK